MKSRLKAEALIIFLLGGAPLIASYLIGGTNNLEVMTKALASNNSLLTYYLISVFITFLLIAGLNWLIWKPTESARDTWKFITTAFYEAGSGALGIIRVAAGVLITLPVIWLVVEPGNFKIEKVAHLILYGLIAYGECVIISGWLKDMQRKARVHL